LLDNEIKIKGQEPIKQSKQKQNKPQNKHQNQATVDFFAVDFLLAWQVGRTDPFSQRSRCKEGLVFFTTDARIIMSLVFATCA